VALATNNAAFHEISKLVVYMLCCSRANGRREAFEENVGNARKIAVTEDVETSEQTSVQQ
jgi:hypothetical protein